MISFVLFILQVFSTPESFDIHSTYTNDSYKIQVRKPDNYSPDKKYHHVFVADGTIGMGEYVIGTNKDWKAEIPDNVIIITIGHQGNWEKKRQRDFLPSDAGGYKNKDFGNAHLFYSFLKSELIPEIKKRFPNEQNKYFIGHSFSGCFALYAALQNDQLFDTFFAISPSVWANHEELLKIEKKIHASGKQLKANISMYAGSLEVFNKVLSSTRKFESALLSRKYKQLSLKYEIIDYANHFSVRKPAIDKILTSLPK